MSDNDDKNLEEEIIDIIEIYDDDGESTKFELLDTFDMENVKYMVMAPLNEDEEAEEEIEHIYVTAVVPGEEAGKEKLEMIEDEKVIDKVFEEFKKRNKDNFEFL